MTELVPWKILQNNYITTNEEERISKLVGVIHASESNHRETFAVTIAERTSRDCYAFVWSAMKFQISAGVFDMTISNNKEILVLYKSSLGRDYIRLECKSTMEGDL